VAGSVTTSPSVCDRRRRREAAEPPAQRGRDLGEDIAAVGGELAPRVRVAVGRVGRRRVGDDPREGVGRRAPHVDADERARERRERRRRRRQQRAHVGRRLVVDVPVYAWARRPDGTPASTARSTSDSDWCGAPCIAAHVEHSDRVASSSAAGSAGSM